MGQQQLLLIVLGLIIVGIAVAISITLFRQSAIDSKRDTVQNECANLATMAIQYYQRAKPLGGGGSSFNGWQVPPQLANTPSGNYEATVSSDHIEIIGTGNEVVTGNDSVRVKVTVYPTSYSSEILY